MTPKERFVNTLQFKPVDHVPDMEICLWAQTRERWINEGAPADLDGSFMMGNAYFGFEGYETAAIDAQVAKLAPVIREDGYIPMIDHAIHPDISLDNFRYYLELKRKVIFGNA